MGKFLDCNNVAYPEFTKGKVISCKAEKGAKPENSVFASEMSGGERRGFTPDPHARIMSD